MYGLLALVQLKHLETLSMKNPLSVTHVLSCLFGAVVLASGAVAAPVDLNGWSEEGPGGGVWTVNSGGTSVVQSVNSPTPTFFISDAPFINNTFSGSLTVGTGDDDFIGFVFGYTAPFSSNADASTDFEYLLFDWKQGNQSSATAGFHLSKVTGDFSDNSINHSDTGASNPFWSHINTTDSNSSFTVLDSDTGVGRGWADNTTYDFELTYQQNNVSIAINGGAFVNETIFDVAGTYTAGSFGFYNFSQADVTYNGFTETVAPPVDAPEPGSLALLALGLAGLGFGRRKAA